MADFEALNHARSQTLRQIREMVSEEAALWARYLNGPDTVQLLAEIEANRARFQALWEQHERVRQAMADAGFMPPPAQSEDSSVEDPVRRKFEERLKSDVEAARAEYYSASQEFRLFASRGTGTPAPMGIACGRNRSPHSTRPRCTNIPAPFGDSTLSWPIENCPKSNPRALSLHNLTFLYH